MTDRELEARLRRAAEHAAPDDLEEVLSRCEERKGAVHPMKRSLFQTRALRGLLAACLVLVLAGAGGGILYSRQAGAVASVISLDVNPSIELRVSKQEKVLSCAALNADAAAVLHEMDGGADLRGVKLDVAVNAVVGALVRHGYLEGLSSAILVSVEDADPARAARMEEHLKGVVSTLLRQQAPNAAVFSQSLTADAELERKAQDTSISVGKAALVSALVEENQSLRFEDAAALTVSELEQLRKTGSGKLPIGVEAAILAAGDYAGTLALSSVTATVDPELDEEPPHYEVELSTPWGEFEYTVHAYSGEVLTGIPGLPAASTQDPITRDRALTLAQEQLLSLHPELRDLLPFPSTVTSEWEDGRQHYEVELRPSGYDFDCEIDALTGAILDWDIDSVPVSASTPAPTAASTSFIGEAAAKAAALKHAGLTESKVTALTCCLSYDDGRAEYYEVEFIASGTEYDYEIDLYTGAVLEWEREALPAAPSQTGPAAPSGDIGADAARAAALKHAGLTEGQISGLEVEREMEDGRVEYDIEFWCGTTEYEYTVDGATGQILEAASEQKD